MTGSKRWAVCKCFYEKNLYLPKLGHVTFNSKEQFIRDYKELLQGTNLNQVLQTIHEEIDRRRSIHPKKLTNRARICAEYRRLNGDIFDKWPLIKDISQEDIREELKGVFSFPLLSKQHCQKILEEFQNFKSTSLPHQRPNSMNKNGILLEELSLERPIQRIIEQIQPIAKELFPDLVGPQGLDSFKAFTVEYDGRENAVSPDLELGTHYDNAEVTLNIPLTKEYEGSELYFEYKNGFKSLSMEVGRGIIHSGRLLHGVMPIEEGYRYNIIIWMRSSQVRNRKCPMCQDVPDLEQVEGTTGDGFTMETQSQQLSGV